MEIEEIAVEVREFLNETDIEFLHGNRTTKCQFCCWSWIVKIFYLVFIFHYCMENSWQLHYLRTLLTVYEDGPALKNFESDCGNWNFRGNDTVQQLQFPIAATRQIKFTHNRTYEDPYEVSQGGYVESLGVKIFEYQSITSNTY